MSETGEHKHRTETGSLTLSTKPFTSYEKEEFKQYVEGLFVAPAVRKPKAPAKLTWKQGKRGLTFTTGRKPKWIMRSEFELLCNEFKMTPGELDSVLKEKGFTLVPGAAEGAALSKNAKEGK